MEGDLVLPSYITSVDTLLTSVPADHVVSPCDHAMFPHPTPMAPLVTRSLSPRTMAQSAVSELWPESLYPDCAPVYHPTYQPLEPECQPAWTSPPPPLTDASKYVITC